MPKNITPTFAFIWKRDYWRFDLFTYQHSIAATKVNRQKQTAKHFHKQNIHALHIIPGTAAHKLLRASSFPALATEGVFFFVFQFVGKISSWSPLKGHLWRQESKCQDGIVTA